MTSRFEDISVPSDESNNEVDAGMEPPSEDAGISEPPPEEEPQEPGPLLFQRDTRLPETVQPYALFASDTEEPWVGNAAGELWHLQQGEWKKVTTLDFDEFRPTPVSELYVSPSGKVSGLSLGNAFQCLENCKSPDAVYSEVTLNDIPRAFCGRGERVFIACAPNLDGFVDLYELQEGTAPRIAYGPAAFEVGVYERPICTVDDGDNVWVPGNNGVVQFSSSQETFIPSNLVMGDLSFDPRFLFWTRVVRHQSKWWVTGTFGSIATIESPRFGLVVSPVNDVQSSSFRNALELSNDELLAVGAPLASRHIVRLWKGTLRIDTPQPQADFRSLARGPDGTVWATGIVKNSDDTESLYLYSAKR